MKQTVLLKKVMLWVAVVFGAVPFIFADYNSYGIPDSTEIRKSIVDSWLTAPLSELQNRHIESRVDSIGTVYQIRMEETVEDYIVVVAPRSFLSVDVVRGESRETTKMEVYPVGAPGSWVLYRNKVTGKPSKLVWYFNSDSDVYVQFRPDDLKTYADMLVCGSYAARSVPMGIRFDRLYTASFSDMQNWTNRSLPWQKVTVVPGQYHSVLQMVAVIKEKIPRISFAEEACYNESGELYSISTGKPFVQNDGTIYVAAAPGHVTLGTAGFLKWIVDGIVEPRIGRGTNIDSLLEPTMSFDSLSKNGVRSQKYNLTFTLDWTRNLAAAALSARSTRTYTYKTGGVDVTVTPFAADVKNGVLVSSSGYIENTGYAIKNIKGLLYVLAVTEPGWCYLAAVRQTSHVVPDDLVFNECAVLFPYFDATGRFGCYVFEKGREISLANFISRYEGSFVHFARVKTTDTFFPK
ncbi:MAG: hypothetical protein J1D88_07905 [Treponema sp.]|nr:hypothetical protein [Treponema sp.]